MDLERLQPESRQSLMSVQRAGCLEIFRQCLVALLPMRFMAHRQLSGVERELEFMRCLEDYSLKNTAAPCMAAPKA